jgi:membrane protease YdiL (CAAX protease family)
MEHVFDPTREGPAVGRAVQVREVVVFLLVLLSRLAPAWVAGARESVGFGVVATATILADVGLVALILYFLWHNGEPLTRIGWRRRGWGREVGLGVALYVPFVALVVASQIAFQRMGLSAPDERPSYFELSGAPQLATASVMVAIVAVAEETIFRGYLLLRLGSALRSMPAAVLLSTALFASGHGYEGAAGVAVVGEMGLIFAAVYLWRGSLVAPMAMHFLQDFIGLVVAPLVGTHGQT